MCMCVCVYVIDCVETVCMHRSWLGDEYLRVHCIRLVMPPCVVDISWGPSFQGIESKCEQVYGACTVPGGPDLPVHILCAY